MKNFTEDVSKKLQELKIDSIEQGVIVYFVKWLNREGYLEEYAGISEDNEIFRSIIDYCMQYNIKLEDNTNYLKDIQNPKPISFGVE